MKKMLVVSRQPWRQLSRYSTGLKKIQVYIQRRTKLTLRRHRLVAAAQVQPRDAKEQARDLRRLLGQHCLAAEAREKLEEPRPKAKEKVEGKARDNYIGHLEAQIPIMVKKNIGGQN